jgi:alkylhydroperoxidase family enzyme
LAKQFGVSEEALAGLEDPDSHPFPPPEGAALRFATAMTRGGGEVPEEVFQGLRAHFGEAEIIEIACVVGLFNYFNRFNTALHVPITPPGPGSAR